MMCRVCVLTLLGLAVFLAESAQAQVQVDILTEDFETFAINSSTVGGNVAVLSNGWVNAFSGDDADWYVNAGPTFSSGTGPSVDSNLGTALGKYLYTETSSPISPSDEFHLLSPLIDLTDKTNPGVRFDYHMFGDDMGVMHVDALSGNTVVQFDLVPPMTGDIDSWMTQDIDLTVFSTIDDFRLRIRGVAGNGFLSDMAVDNFRFYQTVPEPGCLLATAPMLGLALLKRRRSRFGRS